MSEAHQINPVSYLDIAGVEFSATRTFKSLLRNCKKHPDSGRDVDIQCKMLTLVSIECHVVAVPGRPTLAANLTPEVNARVCGTSPSFAR